MQYRVILTSKQTNKTSTIGMSNFIIAILGAFAVMRNVKYVGG